MTKYTWMIDEKRATPCGCKIHPECSTAMFLSDGKINARYCILCYIDFLDKNLVNLEENK